MDKAEILRQWLARGDEELRAAEYLSNLQHKAPYQSTPAIMQKCVPNEIFWC